MRSLILYTKKPSLSRAFPKKVKIFLLFIIFVHFFVFLRVKHAANQIGNEKSEIGISPTNSDVTVKLFPFAVGTVRR